MAGKHRVSIEQAEVMGIRDLFPFGIGDEVTLKPSGAKAVVTDAVFDGELPHGHYRIFYSLETASGQKIETDLNGIELET